MASIHELLDKALSLEWLSVDEAVKLFHQCPTTDLIRTGNLLRQRHKPGNEVTWIIDRNVNTTNVCVANCKFCNFFRVPGHEESYITDIKVYREKIREMERYGGDQLLLQGGHHPDLGIAFYEDLFTKLKEEFPNIKLHALGPPEVHHIAKISAISYQEVLERLKAAGLDSFPGAGAEILTDRVRNIIATGKCSAKEWLDVMRVAHQVGLTTSATMMFGHIESIEERMIHLASLRQVQSEKPKNAVGFLAFIPWPYQDEGTLLRRVKKVRNEVTPAEYVRMIALSRIMLPNIQNIQASWLTVGKSVAQLCLHAGANDFGSIMIEENVVSAAGAPHRFTSKSIQNAISEAGFLPRLRDQQYAPRILPQEVEEQVITY